MNLEIALLLFVIAHSFAAVGSSPARKSKRTAAGEYSHEALALAQKVYAMSSVHSDGHVVKAAEGGATHAKPFAFLYMDKASEKTGDQLVPQMSGYRFGVSRENAPVSDIVQFLPTMMKSFVGSHGSCPTYAILGTQANQCMNTMADETMQNSPDSVVDDQLLDETKNKARSEFSQRVSRTVSNSGLTGSESSRNVPVKVSEESQENFPVVVHSQGIQQKLGKEVQESEENQERFPERKIGVSKESEEKFPQKVDMSGKQQKLSEEEVEEIQETQEKFRPRGADINQGTQQRLPEQEVGLSQGIKQTSPEQQVGLSQGIKQTSPEQQVGLSQGTQQRLPEQEVGLSQGTQQTLPQTNINRNQGSSQTSQSGQDKDLFKTADTGGNGQTPHDSEYDDDLETRSNPRRGNHRIHGSSTTTDVNDRGRKARSSVTKLKRGGKQSSRAGMKKTVRGRRSMVDTRGCSKKYGNQIEQARDVCPEVAYYVYFGDQEDANVADKQFRALDVTVLNPSMLKH